MLGLVARFSLVTGSGGCSLAAVPQLLIAEASLVGERGLRARRLPYAARGFGK